ncbi:hypothetical protein M758_UG330100 [Ceratodon purpureus]|nr:hypothetical protein M758_UG330100 [Ceratodon purpureus]
MASRRKELTGTSGKVEDSGGQGRRSGRRGQEKLPSKKRKLGVEIIKKNLRENWLHGPKDDDGARGSTRVNNTVVDGVHQAHRHVEVDTSSHDKENFGYGTGEELHRDEREQRVQHGGGDDGGQDVQDAGNPNGEYESNNLQRIHLLMNDLTPEERAIVLRTHTLEPELGVKGGGRRFSSRSLEKRETAEKGRRLRRSSSRGDVMEGMQGESSGAAGDSLGVPSEYNQRRSRTADGRVKYGNDIVANVARVREEAEKKIQELRKILEDAEATMPTPDKENGSPSTPRNSFYRKRG